MTSKLLKARNCVNDSNSNGCKMLINIPTIGLLKMASPSLPDHAYMNMIKKSIKNGVCIFEILDHFPTFFKANRTKILYNNKTKINNNNKIKIKPSTVQCKLEGLFYLI